MRIIEEPDASDDDRDVIRAGLRAFNIDQRGAHTAVPLRVIARDDDSRIVGGLLADTYFAWCTVGVFWVEAAHRGAGLGSRILAEAERVAASRGCVGIYLDTFSFQAPAFYKRHGYREFGRLDGFPAGHTRHWLSKAL